MVKNVDKNVQKDLSKYLFDLHNFDAGLMPDEPVEPMFSSADLARVRAEGYEDGYKKATSDAAASRDQHIVDLTTHLTRDLQALLSAEGARAAMFQSELGRLIRDIFSEAFPIIVKKIGPDQIIATIQDIFDNLGPQSSLHVDVSPEDLTDLSARLTPYLSGMDTQFHIQSRADVPAGSFELKWQEGGALRDTQKLKADILSAIERSLAESPETTHTSP